MCGGQRTTFWRWIFYSVCSESQIVSLGSKCPYCLNHLARLGIILFKVLFLFSLGNILSYEAPIDVHLCIACYWMIRSYKGYLFKENLNLFLFIKSKRTTWGSSTCLSSALGEMRRIESSEEPVQIQIHVHIKPSLYILCMWYSWNHIVCFLCQALLRGTGSFMLSMRVNLGGNYIASPQIDYFPLTS